MSDSSDENFRHEKWSSEAGFILATTADAMKRPWKKSSRPGEASNESKAPFESWALNCAKEFVAAFKT